MIGELTDTVQYHAILIRDRKYDGIFYFATNATGAYCRPSCIATASPLLSDCHFFATVGVAKTEGYRACRECHPDRLKDGLSLTILNNIDAGVLNDHGVHGLADTLHISERHLRRLVQNRTGDAPSRINQAKRLDTAKQLVTQTNLPITDIAFQVAFSSLRQFNDVFKRTFNTSPTEMRKTAKTFYPSPENIN
jgi:AraC family transcriptional regulator of adaptative response / DNA-3-methyladenine glycosylase II